MKSKDYVLQQGSSDVLSCVSLLGEIREFGEQPLERKQPYLPPQIETYGSEAEAILAGSPPHGPERIDADSKGLNLWEQEDEGSDYIQPEDMNLWQ